MKFAEFFGGGPNVHGSRLAGGFGLDHADTGVLGHEFRSRGEGRPRQIALRMGDKAGNLAVLTATIADAAAAGCDVVVLPECPLGGWLSATGPAAAEPIPVP